MGAQHHHHARRFCGRSGLLCVLAALQVALFVASVPATDHVSHAVTVQTRNQGIYVPTLGCQYLASGHEFSLSIVIIATSFVFLVLLTGGVARRGMFSKPNWWRKLYTEGILWLALATLFGIPDAVLIKANRNREYIPGAVLRQF